jgi:hypothetical protein
MKIWESIVVADVISLSSIRISSKFSEKLEKVDHRSAALISHMNKMLRVETHAFKG